MERKEFACGFIRARRSLLSVCSLLALPVCLCAGENLLNKVEFNFAEIKFSSSLTLPTESSGKEKALSGSGGLRLNFQHLDLRGYATLPKTDLKKIAGAHTVGEKTDLLNEPRYGAGIFLFKKSVPLTIKAGSNTYSKSASKLKNPSPSTTANPLTKGFSFSTGAGASLPTLTSSAQPLSVAANFSLPEKKSPVPLSVDLFVTEDAAAFGSLSGKISLTRYISLQSAFSFGRFYIENNSTVLKKNNASFAPDWFYCALGETAFHSPLLKLHGYAGFHQSPYESDSMWLKIDGRTTFKILLVDFSFFMIPTAKNAPKAAPLIGGSSSVCRTTEQMSVNPQLIFTFADKNASSLRLGFSALENWKVTSTNTPAQLNVLKLRAGTAYESRFVNARLDWTDANILLAGEPPIKSAYPERYRTLALSGSASGKAAKTAVSASYTKYPPVTEGSATKETYSASVSVAIPKKNLSFKSGIDLTYKEKERHSSSVDASISYTMRKKYVRASAKLEFIMPF